VTPEADLGPRTGPELLVVAGEVSGDMHAAGLVRELLARRPDLRVYGIGGDHLRAAGAHILQDSRDMAVTGFAEVTKRFAFFRRVFLDLAALAERRRPDIVLLVDYPGFNLRFAARAHAMGLRTVYYVCPQVWAWNRSRIGRMAQCVDRLITIFPFEPAHFEGTGLRADFAGHPLVAEAGAALAEPLKTLPWPGEPRVALLPGSRANEIERILPAMWRAAARLECRRPGAGFVVACPNQDIEERVRAAIAAVRGAGPTRIEIVTGHTRQVLRQATAAMVASGTATIEAALLGCPMIVVYRTAAATYLLGRMLVRVAHLGMVNIVAGRELCREFIQGAARPEAMAAAMEPLCADTPERARMVEGLRSVSEALAGGGTMSAAAMVAEELGCAATAR